MRRLSFLFALLVAIPAFAQELPNSVYVFVTNPGGGSGARGSYFTGEVGIAFQRMLAERWSIEGAVSHKHDREGFTIFDQNGNVIESRLASVNSTPVDVTGKYHFVNRSAWKPYIDVGARWTNTSIENRVLASAGGGVAWQFSRALALRFDARAFIGNRPAHLDSVNGSFGFGWRF